MRLFFIFSLLFPYLGISQITSEVLDETVCATPSRENTPPNKQVNVTVDFDEEPLHKTGPKSEQEIKDLFKTIEWSERDWMQRKVLYFDVETTGLGYDAKITQISALLYEHGQFTGRYINYYLNPETPTTPGAYKASKLPDSFLKDKPKFRDVYQEILKLFDEADIVSGYNVGFDVRMLQREVENLGKNGIYIEPLAIIHKDLYHMVRRDWKRANTPKKVISPDARTSVLQSMTLDEIKERDSLAQQRKNARQLATAERKRKAEEAAHRDDGPCEDCFPKIKRVPTFTLSAMSKNLGIEKLPVLSAINNIEIQGFSADAGVPQTRIGQFHDAVTDTFVTATIAKGLRERPFYDTFKANLNQDT